MRSIQKTRHLVFGALGQDGSYLCEKLSSEGDQVIGVIRNSSVIPKEYLNENLTYVRGDILDSRFVYSLFEAYKPTHIYNLASASSVSESFLHPDLSQQINFEFVRVLIENIEKYQLKTGESVFLLQASSSEMFGPDQVNPINENSVHDPRSPYAEHKVMAHNYCIAARSDQDLKIGIAVLFNHESPRRPLKFVSRKITHGAFSISEGSMKKLVLGNINIQRDWGYAPDFVEAISLIARDFCPENFVIATGELHTLLEMCQVAFEAVGISNFLDFVDSDRTLFRVNENSGLSGDATKIINRYQWRPRVSFDQLVKKMVFAESNQSLPL